MLDLKLHIPIDLSVVEIHKNRKLLPDGCKVTVHLDFVGGVHSWAHNWTNFFCLSKSQVENRVRHPRHLRCCNPYPLMSPQGRLQLVISDLTRIIGQYLSSNLVLDLQIYQRSTFLYTWNWGWCWNWHHDLKRKAHYSVKGSVLALFKPVKDFFYPDELHLVFETNCSFAALLNESASILPVKEYLHVRRSEWLL